MPETEDRRMATTIRVPERIWRALRSLAEARALEVGGRPSVSALISEMTEREAAARTDRAHERRG